MTTPLQLLEVDPAKLQINPANVRKKMRSIDELAASIAAIGVQQPLIVRRNGTDDTFVIVAGERRALAAIKAKASTVPVIVRGFDDDGQAELTAMMVENLHREDLSAADEAAGFEQLAAFGMSVDEIVNLTGRPKDRVTTGLTVARSDVSAAVTAKYDLTLEQAAAIAEFDTDRNTVKELTFAAQKAPQQFDHILQRARQDRERVEARAAKVAELQSAGVKILKESEHLGWALNAKAGVHLSSIVDAKGKTLTPAGHKDCPGHVAQVDRWGRMVEYGCSDPAKHGHKLKTSSSAARASGAAKKAGVSPEEKAKAAAAKLKAEEEAKALEAATVVRRRFVRELLGRKTPPKGTLAYLVPLIIDHADELYDDAKVVEELTGAKSTSHNDRALLQLTAGASDARLQVVLLAFVACAHESADWNNDMLAPRAYQNFDLEAGWLRFLATCGYGLAEIEQRVIDVAFPPAKAARGKKTTSS